MIALCVRTSVLWFMCRDVDLDPPSFCSSDLSLKLYSYFANLFLLEQLAMFITIGILDFEQH